MLGVVADLAARDEGGITAISTLLLAVITVWLVYVARDQAKTTRAQLRAYIRPDIAVLKKFSLTEPVEVVVTWQNCGQTPAKNFEAHGIVWIAALPLPDNAAFEDDPKEAALGRHGRTTLFPGSSTNSDYVGYDKNVPREIWDAISQGTLAIYAIGEAFYLDIFDRDHKSQFCRFIDPVDAKALIDAERNNTALNINVRWNASHILNGST